ncbi:35309_t:CDS:2 [Gigaspora margarita]|uniref:35309_t:CDS:1 n=1 Tax=Gigaspora margarita TaxID=4874 RepID=A0ABN7VUC5_GIGMA|nr:35309_t:CDS:2 [Gigaspora margarita]
MFCWSDADKDKKKSSGVGLLIDKQWKKHIENISKSKNFKQKVTLHNWLNKNNFAGIYRVLNLTEKAFTWINGFSSTKINQIWVSNNLSLGLLAANITEMDMFTGSDYVIVLASLHLIHLTSNCTLMKIKKNQVKRTIFLYDEAKDNWNSYHTDLDNSLLNNIKTEYLFQFDEKSNLNGNESLNDL